MFKDIPGNLEFQIAINGRIIHKDNEGRNPIIIAGKVNIKMFNVDRQVDLLWLAQISHYEVTLPEQYKEKIWNINFVEANAKVTRSISDQMMVITKPILLFNKYRVIPCFTRYAISNSGEILDIKNEKVIEKIKKHNEYPTVHIYNPDRNDSRYILVHRLVALAWVKNDDFVGKPIVNHIDGNKENFYYKNLEWCSYLENNIHAVNTGLRTDNFVCKIRDAITKEVHHFHSIKQACNYMGIRDDLRLSGLAYKTKHKLIENRYEIKLENDDTPWFYEKHETGTVAGRYHLIATMPDGTIQEHPDVRVFKQVFKVWNTSNVIELVKKAETMYPGMKITIIDNYNVSSVQAYNLETKEIIEADGIRHMCKSNGQEFNCIRRALMAGETRVANGFAYRFKTDEPWNTNFTMYESSSKCVLATHKETNEELRFSSQRAAALHFKVDRSIIRRFTKSGRYFRLWKLSEN